MVSVQAGPRFFEGLVLYAAAADIDFPQLRVIPWIDHLGTPSFQYLTDRILHHLHIVRLNIIKPVPIALLRSSLIRHSQKNPHGPVRIHPGPAPLLKFDGPDTGSGSLQNILHAFPCFKLVLLFLLHHGIDIPLGKYSAILLRRFLCSGIMDLHMFQPICIVLHLITHIELLLFLKLSQHIVPFRYGKKSLLIAGNHVPGNILLHSRSIPVFKTDGPIHAHLFAVPVYLTFAGVEVHLIYPQIIHAEGMENVMAALLKFTDQIAPF